MGQLASKHRPVWFPTPSTYKSLHERENDGSGEIQRLDRSGVHYLGTGPKTSISAVQCLGKGPGIFISLVHSTPHPCTDMKALITWAIIGTSEQMQLS